MFVGFGWLLLGLIGFGWFRLASVGFGWIWLASVGFGWFRLVSVGFGWRRLASVGFGFRLVNFTRFRLVSLVRDWGLVGWLASVGSHDFGAIFAHFCLYVH